MKNKILFSLFAFVLLFGLATISPNKADAQVATFPAGCTSALGYSTTSGLPCNGTATATAIVAGCSTALGYSVTTGLPCSGSSVAIQFLAGCTSVYGYSTVNGAACNGTLVASVLPSNTPVVPVNPGFPTTGSSTNPLVNILILLSSLAVVGSVVYFSRKHRVAS